MITLQPPPKYTKERADHVYGEAFRRGVEFVVNQYIPGDVLEFGTLNGFTGRKFAELMVELDHKGSLWLFDSFEGMPEARGVDLECPEIVGGGWKPGTPVMRHPDAANLIKDELTPLLGERLHIVPGWFEETIHNAPHCPSIVHIDCDMYESTYTVLRNLRFRQGSIIYFDDWNSGRASDRFGERAAVSDVGLLLEPWFSYGWSGQAFICQEDR